MVKSLIISLALTLLIELSLSLLLGIKTVNDIKVVILVNVCTNPVVVYIANCLRLLNNELFYNFIVIIMEIIVVIVEFVLFKKFLTDYKKSPFLLSFINNSVSYATGILISIIF